MIQSSSPRMNVKQKPGIAENAGLFGGCAILS
jgi:hypothetical protein